jgi:hypothetical protein
MCCADKNAPIRSSLTIGQFLIFVAILLTAVTAIYAGGVRLTDKISASPWESAIAMEAVRLNAGLPVYESAHATHMYGPLLTVVLAAIFRVAGLNLLMARAIMSAFSLVLCFLLAWILSPRKRNAQIWWAFLLFLAITFRTDLIFFSAQPDCLAGLLGVLGLYFWITRRRSRVRVLLAIGFFISAMLTKQTAASFALIPIVYHLIWRRNALLQSTIPALCLVLVLLLIRVFWPQLFSAMVSGPASIRIYPLRIFSVAVYFVATFPLLFLGLRFAFNLPGRIRTRERWIFSALIVLLPVSICAMAKSGGSYNSLLFAYVAVIALFVSQLDVISTWIPSLPRWRNVAAGGVIAVAIFCSFFFQFERSLALLQAHGGDEKYENAVSITRQFGGRVVSPQDPTIAFRANGYVGRSLFFELDAHSVKGNWPGEVPTSMQRELEGANYFIEVRTYVPTLSLEPALAANKFHRISIPELAGSVYTAWAKTGD